MTCCIWLYDPACKIYSMMCVDSLTQITQKQCEKAYPSQIAHPYKSIVKNPLHCTSLPFEHITISMSSLIIRGWAVAATIFYTKGHWVTFNKTKICLASLAHLGEHLLQSWEVLGSNPSQVQWVARSLYMYVFITQILHLEHHSNLKI